MEYRPGQVKDAIGITEETFRHWRSSLSPLHKKKGKAAKFGSGELLALSIVKKLTSDLGIKISALVPVCESLFELCKTTPFIEFSNSHLLFFFDSKKVYLKRSENINEIVDISIVVNCAPIAKEISDRLFSQNNISPQAELLFPPAAIGKRG